MQTYKEILDHYLSEAEKVSLEFIDSTFPDHEPLTTEVLSGMPQRYLNAMVDNPGSKQEFLQKMFIQDRIETACNLLLARNMLPEIESLSKKELALGYRLFMIGFGYGVSTGRDPDLFEELKPLYHSEGQSKAKKQDWDRRNEAGMTAAQGAIEWMLKRWAKGEEADHAAFSAHAYDKFKLNPNEISRPKFLALVKEAAKKHYPHKIRGIRKPPAL
jgi:hypothetical protein